MPTPVIIDCDPGPRRRDGPSARRGKPRAGARGRHDRGGERRTRERDRQRHQGPRRGRARRHPRRPRAPTARCCIPARTADEVHGATGLDGPDLPPPVARAGADPCRRAARAEAARAPADADPDRPADQHRAAARAAPRAARADRADRADGRRRRPRQRHAERRVQPLVRPRGGATGSSRRRSTSRWSASTSPTARCSAPPAPRRCARRVTQAPSSRTCTRFYRRFHLEVYGHDDTPVHDALAVAHVIDPDAAAHRAPQRRDRHHPGPRPRPDGRRPAQARSGASPTPTWRWTSTPARFIDLLTERIGSLA